MLPLDLPAASPATVAPARRTVFAGFTGPQLALGAVLLLALIWGMWVTRTLTTAPQQHIVKANLSRIVGDYVQAQARSATPPDQVRAQMQQFMASLDTELQRRSAQGQVVLVGEAVLSKSVPDITGDVVTSIYAGGVARPRPAALQVAPPALVPPVSAAQPSTAMPPRGVLPTAPASNPFEASAPAAQAPVASVSSFGGSDGNPGQ
nr:MULTISPECIES: TrbI F-type domain-containing protein [unclassified Sphingomonas]